MSISPVRFARRRLRDLRSGRYHRIDATKRLASSSSRSDSCEKSLYRSRSSALYSPTGRPALSSHLSGPGSRPTREADSGGREPPSLFIDSGRSKCCSDFSSQAAEPPAVGAPSKVSHRASKAMSTIVRSPRLEASVDRATNRTVSRSLRSTNRSPREKSCNRLVETGTPAFRRSRPKSATLWRSGPVSWPDRSGQSAHPPEAALAPCPPDS